MSALRAFFAELGDYLGEKYFSPDLGDLNYLNSDAAVRFLPLCIVGLCAGIFIAALIYYYNCEYLGRAVRRLYAAGAFAPAEAKTLAEIRCGGRAYRKNLRRGTVLSKYVVPAETESGAEPRYYIPEDRRATALKRYKPLHGGVAALFGILIACAALCFILLYYTPDVVRLADNAIGLIK